MRSNPRRLLPSLAALVAAILPLIAVLAIAGCGGGSDEGSASSGAGSNGGGPAGGAEPTGGGTHPLVDWPLFGRVPARTHYLPGSDRDLDPPLKQAWSINTHALIEFPPAIHAGVAYVINKY